MHLLECPGKRHICVVVHPVGAETELASGLGDAGSKTVLGVVKAERAIFGNEGAMDVVDVLSALAVGEGGVEDHDGSAVHDEAHLAPEGVVQPLGEIGERFGEYLARERNVVHFFQSRNCGSRHCHGPLHRSGYVHEGYDGAWNRCCCPYGNVLGKGVERHFGAGG